MEKHTPRHAPETPAMDRHLLLAVSEDKSALHGLRFVSAFMDNRQGLRLTLFYTAPRPLADQERFAAYEEKQEAARQRQRSEAQGRKALAQARQRLLGMGFAEEQVETKFVFRRHSKIMDIILESAQGLYDAVVLGRRGLSWLEATVEDSVTTGLLQQEGLGFPIWICRKPDPERRNVLLCVDGSEASYRMVDHAAFMLGPQEHRITAFAVRKAPAPGRDENMREHCLQILAENGFPEERFAVKSVVASKPDRAILEEAHAGRYAVVGVGRTGMGRGMFKSMFMGSVSTTLLKELTGASLWAIQ
jgi:nucleotide-binding universal stress UspA family protein